MHVGPLGVMWSRPTAVADTVALMDRLSIGWAIATDELTLLEGFQADPRRLRDMHEDSRGRICYLAVYHPGHGDACLRAMREHNSAPGLVGIKIHPSFHGTPAEDDAYEPAWRFAAEHDLAILTHSWSAADYNPVQALSTPGRFERFVRAFPTVRLVLAHAGGRGLGRHEATRLAGDYPNVYLDVAGDVFCYRLIEKLVDAVGAQKVLYGSDVPWADPRANLCRVLLAEISDEAKAKILRHNAAAVYKLDSSTC